jgi:hypothetical protein
MNLPKLDKNLMQWAALAVGGFAIFTSLPKAADNLKPAAQQATRMSEQFDVLTDKESGNIYGWIEGKDGERRFVKMDKNSENAIRKEREDALEKERRERASKEEDSAPAQLVYVSQKKDDVRSERIFTRNSDFENFKVNARIKYRLREKKMLYRLAISLPALKIDPITGEPNQKNCLTSDQESTLLSLKQQKENKVRFRFVDADSFWLRDSLIPLGEAKANNYKTTVIDSYNKDNCGKINKLVFHGRLSEFTLPDYSWVEDGKLLFDGVQIVVPSKEEDKNK